MKQKAVICDLDGTLASVEHRRHFVEGLKKDWASFHGRLNLDNPVPIVLGLLRAVKDDVVRILTTGRPANYRYHSEWWLMEHEIPYDLLLMRPAGDTRKDSIVKRELYDQFILPQFDVVYAIDDRPQIVDLWKSLGIPVLQVVDPGVAPVERGMRG